MNKSYQLAELAMCAVRYALGRHTYVSASIPSAVLNFIEEIPDFALKVMIKDIERVYEWEELEDIDAVNWIRFKKCLEKELKERNNP